MLDRIIDFLFPNYCGICGKKINERYTCEKCLNILECYREKVFSNTKNQNSYEQLLCLFEYNGIIKDKMLQYKFKNKKYLSRMFGELLASGVKKHNIVADMIIPVPISKRRLQERGYNQCEYIAKFFSKISNIQLEKNCLIKIKDNPKQSTLSAISRITNVMDAYKVLNVEKIFDKTIILLDDIYTTGATMNECAKVLKKAGAKKVIALAVLYSSK